LIRLITVKRLLKNDQTTGLAVDFLQKSAAPPGLLETLTGSTVKVPVQPVTGINAESMISHAGGKF
jgi:hypothetical protein